MSCQNPTWKEQDHSEVPDSNSFHCFCNQLTVTSDKCSKHPKLMQSAPRASTHRARMEQRALSLSCPGGDNARSSVQSHSQNSDPLIPHCTQHWDQHRELHTQLHSTAQVLHDVSLTLKFSHIKAASSPVCYYWPCEWHSLFQTCSLQSLRGPQARKKFDSSNNKISGSQGPSDLYLWLSILIQRLENLCSTNK